MCTDIKMKAIFSFAREPCLGGPHLLTQSRATDLWPPLVFSRTPAAGGGRNDSDAGRCGLRRRRARCAWTCCRRWWPRGTGSASFQVLSSCRSSTCYVPSRVRGQRRWMPGVTLPAGNGRPSVCASRAPPGPSGLSGFLGRKLSWRGGNLSDGRRAPPLAGRQRVPRAAPAAPARHPRRDEVAPSSRARPPGRTFQATAPPRWRGPVFYFSVSAGHFVSTRPSRRADRRGLWDAAAVRRVSVGSRKTRACCRRHFRPKTAPKPTGKGTRDLPPPSAPPDAEDAAPGSRPKAAAGGGSASASPK